MNSSSSEVGLFKMAADRSNCDYGLGLKIQEGSPGDRLIAKTGEKCKLCKVKESKYTCPKCNLNYCGLDCYKGASHKECSESFYKQNVLDELKTMKSTDHTRKRTIEMLKKMAKQDNSHEDEYWEDGEALTNLEKRIEGLDLDSATFDEIFHRLTEKEKKLFDSVILNGEVEISELCTPWWMEDCIRGMQKMEEVNEDDSKMHEVPKSLPKIESLKVLLPNKSPSPLLPFSICEVLTGYCFIYRLYNGEFHETLQEVLDTVLELSPVLHSSNFYEDMDSCLRSFIQRIKSSLTLKDTLDPVKISLNDLAIVMTKYTSVESKAGEINLMPMSLLCVSDLHNLFTSGAKELENIRHKTKEKKQKKKLYAKTVKKLYFLAAWLVENQHIMRSLGDEVKDLKSEISNYWDLMREENEEVENHLNQIRYNSNARLVKEL